MSPDAMNETGTAFIDLWLVKLRSGEIRTMTLDALDEAFNSGFVDEDSLLLPPNGTSWTRLGTAAGLDASAADANESMPRQSGTLVMALRPRRMVSPASHQEATVMPRVAPPSGPRLDAPSTRRDTPMARRPAPSSSRSLAGRFAVLAALVLVVSFTVSSAVRYAFRENLASTPAALAAANKLGVLETTSADVTPAPPLASGGESEAKSELHEASPRDAQVRKDGAGRQRRSAPRRGGRTPFVHGGDRFDPMNSSL